MDRFFNLWGLNIKGTTEFNFVLLINIDLTKRIKRNAMNNNNNSKPNYLWSWVKIAFVSIVFFSLMFLQVFQAKKVSSIQDEIDTTEKELMKISLELADVNLQIENIRNSDIIDNIATRGLGMVKVDKTKYKIIESNNERE